MATERTIPAPATDLSVKLETFRCLQDWTYLQLTDEIARVTNRRRDEDCWRRLCQGLTPKPHRTTLDILETYLAAVQPIAAAKRNGRRAKSAKRAA